MNINDEYRMNELEGWIKKLLSEKMNRNIEYKINE